MVRTRSSPSKTQLQTRVPPTRLEPCHVTEKVRQVDKERKKVKRMIKQAKRQLHQRQLQIIPMLTQMLQHRQCWKFQSWK